MSAETKTYEDKMTGVINHLVKEHATIRAGRANPAILDKVTVDYYGTPTPINQVAAVSVAEARVLTISPWDASLMHAIEKAILTSDIGINPTNDGGATKVAAKTVAVTQAAAGGSEPAGDTYDKITKVAELVNGMTGFIGCEPGGTYGLQLVTGFAAYGQGFTAAYTYDETKKTLSLTSGNYTAIEFTFEAVADGFNIKQGDKYLIGTGIIDNGKPKQGLVLADAPAQPWTFTEDASGVIATTSASGTVDGQAFNYPAIYMMCANSASSRFLRPYVQASYGKGFCFFKKN